MQCLTTFCSGDRRSNSALQTRCACVRDVSASAFFHESMYFRLPTLTVLSGVSPALHVNDMGMIVSLVVHWIPPTQQHHRMLVTVHSA